MANKSYPYEITWCYKDEGNRLIEDITEVTATTVQRAVSKLVKILNEGAEEEYHLRASDLMVIDVRSHKLTNAILAFKKSDE